ncbi:hypothetical protein F5J12DRAFT_928239 [Pisolithus orientalis]|uniref:uncharacterized protein n=1 Tax=Pisolithus orientalis TaxID=936130 RepID=UPI002224173B|nr:uncharacterized protein F5J12DRAFT_928239 [Pisolithus orientalis]KAI6002250.1 hypothetical protein F5J12DRAFT_928239 [Pisolithus orientalis]
MPTYFIRLQATKASLRRANSSTPIALCAFVHFCPHQNKPDSWHQSSTNDLMPSVAEDVCKAQQCEADDMLEYILSRASKTPDDLIDLNGHVLLDRCINKVLPICNGHTQDIEGFLISDIREALIDYIACKQEDDLYQPFVLASNTALAHLKRLKIDDARLGSWDEHVLMIGQDKTPMFLRIGKDGNELEETEPQEAPVAESAHKPTQESTQMASRKCTLETNSESCMSKQPGMEEPGGYVIIQTALYAAEMQSANIVVKHALNCIVIGNNIWIWYYDHQGLISVAGFNFVQDLPCFLVLLYALQQFNLEDWEGDHIESHTIKVDGKTLKLDNRERDTRYRVKGCGTSVMEVTCKALKQEKLVEMVNGMVAKIYWAEEA